MATFKYGKNEYKLKEPSIELWNKLMALKDWSDETEFSIKLISELCDLTEDEVRNRDWQEIVPLAQSLSNYILQDSKQFYKEFEFEGLSYRFIDLNKLSFGEFIDLDTFLLKPVSERIAQSSLLMAMLYRELDDKNKLVPYDSSKLEERAERFKKLPIKYLNGASTFFLLLEKVLRQNTQNSLSKNPIKNLMIRISQVGTWLRSLIFGVGLIFLPNLRMRILRRLMKSVSIR